MSEKYKLLYLVTYKSPKYSKLPYIVTFRIDFANKRIYNFVINTCLMRLGGRRRKNGKFEDQLSCR